MHEKCDAVVKVILCGDIGAGKTTLMYKYMTGRFNSLLRPNDGVGMHSKVLMKNDEKIRLTIWDTAGQERFRSMTYSYYRNAHGCLLVFDVTQSSTFDNILNWYDAVKEFCPTVPKMVLVGTKCHMPREVTPERAEKLAEHLNIPYIEVISEHDVNVSAAFENLVELIISELKQRRSNVHVVRLQRNEPGAQKKVYTCTC